MCSSGLRNEVAVESNEDFLVGVSVARWGKGGVLVIVRRWNPTPLEAAMGNCEGVK